jgi:hypothetical protein
VFDLSHPRSPEFITYRNARDFTSDPEAGAAGDLGPEGVIVVQRWNHGRREPLLILSNEISGTTSVYAIRKVTR